MSISNEAVIQLIQTRLPEAEISVQGDGYKYQAEIVSTSFQGLSKVKRHQLVYAAVNEAITSGQLHALTILAYTPEEKAAS